MIEGLDHFEDLLLKNPCLHSPHPTLFNEDFPPSVRDYHSFGLPPAPCPPHHKIYYSLVAIVQEDLDTHQFSCGFNYEDHIDLSVVCI